MKKYGILTILMLMLVFFACDESQARDDRNTPAYLAKQKKKNNKIPGHWKRYDNAQPDNIYEALAQVVDLIQAPLRDKGLFFRILKTKSALVHYFFIIFADEKFIHEVKKGWNAPKIGHTKNPGHGHWSVIAGKDKSPFGSLGVFEDDKDEDDEQKDYRLVYEYHDYQPRGSNLIVNGVLKAMYRSEGRNAEGKPVAAIGFSANKDGTDNVDTLEITGLYDATLKFIYKPTGIHSDITVLSYDEKMFGNDSMFTGDEKDDKSKIVFSTQGETVILDVNFLKKLFHVEKLSR